MVFFPLSSGCRAGCFEDPQLLSRCRHMIRTRQERYLQFCKKKRRQKRSNFPFFPHSVGLIYLWLLGALHMIPSVIYSFPHNRTDVLCAFWIILYILPSLTRETYLIIPFALDRKEE